MLMFFIDLNNLHLSHTQSLYGTDILCDFYNCICLCVWQCAFIDALVH